MVPICHVVVENDAIKGAVQTRVRRYARRLVRPHVATGITDADRSLWQEWWQRDISTATTNGSIRQMAGSRRHRSTSPGSWR